MRMLYRPSILARIQALVALGKAQGQEPDCLAVTSAEFAELRDHPQFTPSTSSTLKLRVFKVPGQFHRSAPAPEWRSLSEGRVLGVDIFVVPDEFAPG